MPLGPTYGKYGKAKPLEGATRESFDIFTRDGESVDPLCGTLDW